MAGYMQAEGLDALGRMLQGVSDGAAEIASAGLYAGAGVVADALTRSVKSIQTEEFHYAPEGSTRLPSPEEKDALRGKVGIARFQGSSTEIDTLIGFAKAGYVSLGGRKPVAVIARAINSGTSFMRKQPVFRRATSGARAAATQATVEAAEKKLKELIK